MNKEMYKDIVGISEFFNYFPNVHWCYFHEVLEFRWYREFDYEEWCDRFCVDLKISDMEKKDIILLTLKNVSGGRCEFLGWISGFDIVNKFAGAGYELQYEVILLTLKNVSGGRCEFLGWISGFDIVNKFAGAGYELQYEVLDFEDSQIHFYCDEIEIKIISINGKEIK